MITRTRSPRLVKALYVVVALVVLDVVTTLVGVLCMGMTELNPIAALLGFGTFMVTKIAISALGACFLYRYGIPVTPTVAKYCIGFLIVFYAVVCASNLCQIVGQIL